MSLEPPAPTLRLALAAVEAACNELTREVQCLDAEHGMAGAHPRSVARLILRGVPDLCSPLASHLRDLSAEDVEEVLNRCFTRAPFDDVRVREHVDGLRGHLHAYAMSLTRWKGWVPTTLEIGEPDGHDASVRWVTAWERTEDDAVAADLVGYVHDPEDLATPDEAYALFARDAKATCARLGDEYGDDRVKGIRLWILGADRRPVVRWLTPH